ncbi:MAG: BFD-like (2Fe-2S) protein [Desulfobulbus propionicus]|nr:MAG: BFD-like (2Fe-2S) protein [Desulfobulbus propionicus]
MTALTQITPVKNTFTDNDLVCYCFKYTKKDIEKDFQEYGYSRVLARITTEKKNKGCNCEVKNPKKR